MEYIPEFRGKQDLENRTRDRNMKETKYTVRENG
jgi:hypothetical protein